MESALQLRQRALESAFGPADSMHIHATVPFELGLPLGGRPDMLTWSAYIEGAKLYVTCDLTGSAQLANRDGQYELAVAQPQGEDWAVDLVRRLAYYTLDTPLNDGETMDIAPAAPAGSDIVGFLFRRIARFRVFDQSASVLCCVGITAPELECALEDGTDFLYENFPGEHLVTPAQRRSFV